MNELVAVKCFEDIFEHYKDNSVGKLLAYHNLGVERSEYQSAQLLIGTCMDHRIQLNIPQKFAYTIRTGGGNLKPVEFNVSYVIAMGGIKTIALLGHNLCGMANLREGKVEFINKLVDNAGWDRDEAEEHFDDLEPHFEIGNEIQFVLSETERLRNKYPKIQVAPLYYNIEDHGLYQIKENR